MVPAPGRAVRRGDRHGDSVDKERRGCRPESSPERRPGLQVENCLFHSGFAP